MSGLTSTTKISTYHDILNNHQHCAKVVTLHCVEGWDVTILWEGVLVRDLIKEAGIDPRANTVIFYAHDGYMTSFPISYIMNNDIIMAYKMNNVTLQAERGYPFELVAENKWDTSGSSGSIRSNFPMTPTTTVTGSKGGTRTPVI